MISRLLRPWTSPLDPGDLLASLVPSRSPGVARIERLQPLGTDAVRVTLRPPSGWPRHRPGQFVTIGVDVDGVRHQRCYSITSLPDRADGCIELGVRCVPGGVVSTHLAHVARPGDRVHVDPPAGDFTLPTRVGPLLLLSGGAGVTPVLALLRELVARDEPRDIVVLHHAPTADRVMFAAELADLAGRPGISLDIVLTEAGGRVLDGAELERRCGDWRRRTAFVCGPPPMVDWATAHWTATGELGKLHLERFVPATARPSALDRGGRVTFAASGLVAEASPGTTLLDLAESIGLQPPTGCRMGICHTCTTPLVAGVARDVHTDRLSDAGACVRICSSVPAGDLTLDL